MEKAYRRIQHWQSLAVISVLAVLLTPAPASAIPSWMQPIQAVANTAIDNPFTRSFRSSNNDQNSAITTTAVTAIAARDNVAGEDTFTANCLLNREPEWSDNPTLYFFSSATHSKKNLGCTPHMTISLNITKSLDPDDLNRPDGLVLDEAEVKRNISALYNASLPTYLLTHGFLASWDGDSWMCHTKDLVLNNTDANVFIVDWSGGAKPMLPIDYGLAVTNTRYVGITLGAFVKWLLNHSERDDASNFHLIGHSLGAHVSGFIGYYVGSVGRIIGLDPAGPCYSVSSSNPDDIERAHETGYLDDSGLKRRLSKQSAKLVVAMHTDAGMFGLNENCAHYDVYVNGGSDQPICKGLLTSLLEDQSLGDISCSHTYAHMIIDTISWPKFASDIIGREDLRGATTLGSGKGDDPALRMQSCYPIAYQCPSWEAFKSGECGFCPKNSMQCVFTGLESNDAHRDELRLANSSVYSQLDTDRMESGGFGAEEGDDDDIFNGESYGDSDDNSLTSSAARTFSLGNRDPRMGQHFLKAAASNPSCLYHYQVVVAVERRSSFFRERRAAARRYYYLQVPLDKRATLLDSDGDRLPDRLVQVSHKVDRSSASLKVLGGAYMKRLRRVYPDSRELELGPHKLHFYTALITFELNSNGSRESNHWNLERPLMNLREARLWSASSSHLERVRWVGLNYMSGLSESIRDKNSHLFVSADNVVTKGDKLDTAIRPSIDELQSKQQTRAGALRLASAPLRLTGKSLLPVNCLVSSLHEPGSSANNFKCGRAESELKYFVKLRALTKQFGQV